MWNHLGACRVARRARAARGVTAATVTVAALALAACSPEHGPSAEAVEAYVGRKAPATEPGPGPAQPSATAAAPASPSAAADAGPATPDASPASASQAAAPPAAPLARRLRVTVVRGEGLPDTDAGPGETDPYVVLDYEGERFKTSVADGTLEPVWGDSFVLDVRPGAALGVTLMDRDAWSSDEKLGVVNDPLPPVHVGERVELDVRFRGGDFGTVRVALLGLE